MLLTGLEPVPVPPVLPVPGTPVPVAPPLPEPPPLPELAVPLATARRCCLAALACLAWRTLAAL